MSHTSRPPDREGTFRSLYESVYPDVLRFIQRRAHRDQAEDVVAEAFLVVWRRLDELPRTSDDVRAWIFGITRNILLNSHRGEQRRHALGVRLAVAAAFSSHDAADEEAVSRADLARAWQRLSEVQQEALALVVFEGLDAPRAATVLGISPVAFRLRVSRARRALRLHLNYLPKHVTTPARDLAERTTER